MKKLLTCSITKKNRDNPDSCIIKLNGNLTIDQVKNIQKKSILALQRYEHFVINLEKIEVIDLSGIQFIYSLIKKINHAGKKIEITPIKNDNSQLLLLRCDFNELTKG